MITYDEESAQDGLVADDEESAQDGLVADDHGVVGGFSVMLVFHIHQGDCVMRHSLIQMDRARDRQIPHPENDT